MFIKYYLLLMIDTVFVRGHLGGHVFNSSRYIACMVKIIHCGNTRFMIQQNLQNLLLFPVKPHEPSTLMLSLF